MATNCFHLQAVIECLCLSLFEYVTVSTMQLTELELLYNPSLCMLLYLYIYICCSFAYFLYILLSCGSFHSVALSPYVFAVTFLFAVFHAPVSEVTRFFYFSYTNSN